MSDSKITKASALPWQGRAHFLAESNGLRLLQNRTPAGFIIADEAKAEALARGPLPYAAVRDMGRTIVAEVVDAEPTDEQLTVFCRAYQQTAPLALCLALVDGNPFWRCVHALGHDGEHCPPPLRRDGNEERGVEVTQGERDESHPRDYIHDDVKPVR